MQSTWLQVDIFPLSFAVYRHYGLLPSRVGTGQVLPRRPSYYLVPGYSPLQHATWRHPLWGEVGHCCSSPLLSHQHLWWFVLGTGFLASLLLIQKEII